MDSSSLAVSVLGSASATVVVVVCIGSRRRRRHGGCGRCAGRVAAFVALLLVVARTSSVCSRRLTVGTIMDGFLAFVVTSCYHPSSSYQLSRAGNQKIHGYMSVRERHAYRKAALVYRTPQPKMPCPAPPSPRCPPVFAMNLRPRVDSGDKSQQLGQQKCGQELQRWL